MAIDAEAVLEPVGGAGGSPQQKVFGRFFQDIDGCLSVMKAQSAIASGSAVLRALLPKATWEPSDLDLYVGKVGTEREFNWLLPWMDFLGDEGYSMKHPGKRFSRVNYQHSESVSFVNASSGRTVQVIKVEGPVGYVFKTFWGTHLKNIATHDALYCPYPQATVERRQMVVSKIKRESELLAYEKYRDRGFRRILGEGFRSSEEFQHGRSLDDKLTRVVRYDQTVGVRGVDTEYVKGVFLDGEPDESDLSDIPDMSD